MMIRSGGGWGRKKEKKYEEMCWGQIWRRSRSGRGRGKRVAVRAGVMTMTTQNRALHDTTLDDDGDNDEGGTEKNGTMRPIGLTGGGDNPGEIAVQARDWTQRRWGGTPPPSPLSPQQRRRSPIQIQRSY